MLKKIFIGLFRRWKPVVVTIFHDKLNKKHISDENYIRAKTVWRIFNCKSLVEHSDINLKTDVLLFSDVFENFRKRCLDNYNQDPCHYYIGPDLSWGAMLNYTKIGLKLLADIVIIDISPNEVFEVLTQIDD